MIIPLTDPDGNIHSTHRMDEYGTKRFLSGNDKADHFALIGGPLETAPAIPPCEGRATGATAHAATNLPLVAAINAGNLVCAAPQVPARFPTAALVIRPNNDFKPGRAATPIRAWQPPAPRPAPRG